MLELTMSAKYTPAVETCTSVTRRGDQDVEDILVMGGCADITTCAYASPPVRARLVTHMINNILSGHSYAYVRAYGTV